MGFQTAFIKICLLQFLNQFGNVIGFKLRFEFHLNAAVLRELGKQHFGVADFLLFRFAQSGFAGVFGFHYQIQRLFAVFVVQYIGKVGLIGAAAGHGNADGVFGDFGEHGNGV